MDDLLSEFLTETAESLDNLDVELVQLEQNPNDPELLSNIFRLVHTIKGTCGFLGLPRLESVAHAGENVLGNFRDGTQTVTPDAVSLILEALDCIKEILAVIERTEAEPEGDDSDLISRLDAMYRLGRDGVGAVEAPAPAEPAAEASPPPPAASGPLIEQVGGVSAVDAAVELLYRKITADPDLSPFFEGVDMARLQGRQVEFMVKALGGPDEYRGADMRSAHRALVEKKGLNEEHFGKVAGHLIGALQELEVPQDLIDQIIAVVATTKDDVLNLGAAPQPVPAMESEPAQPATQKVSGKSPAAETTESGGTSIASQSIRVSVELLEDLMTKVSELVLTRNQLLQMVRKYDDSEFKVPLQRLSHVTTDLQEGVMKTRMQPIGNAWSKLPRIVRDLAVDLGKKIDLQMIGADTELDRQVLDLIKDPLTHMVRNSGDHGLEQPEDRIKAGKPETGTVTLNAFHEGGHIIIEISDDGRGIALSKVKEKIIANNLATAGELENMADQQIYQYIFKPGFSTAEKVTNVSGRGVGMDVVKTNIEKIGGHVELFSTEGKGSKFTIKIPLTLAIVSALIVECGGERFAIPQLNVVELVRVSSATENRIEKINDTPLLRLRNRLLPLVSLAGLLKIRKRVGAVERELDQNAALVHQEQEEIEPSERSGVSSSWLEARQTDEIFIVVTQVGTNTYGIIVDRVFDTEEIVVKPVAPILRNIPYYSGNTILGDGSVIMILDPNGIASSTGDTAGAAADMYEQKDAEDLQGTANSEAIELLIFRASGEEPKAVPLALIARLEELELGKIEYSHGIPLIQYRGNLMPLLSMDPNFEISTAGRQPVLVFTDRDRNMGLMVDEIVDIVEDQLRVELSTDIEGILGSAVIAGKATDVIDASYYLTEAFGDWFDNREKHSGNKPTPSNRVLLVDDSAFFRNLLTPLLTSAGYTVTVASSADRALEMREMGRMFDIIISDIEMPGTNGFDFARKVREDGPWQDVVLVALSAYSAPTDLQRGREAGFDDYVAKLDRDALLDSLDKSLSGISGAA